MSLSERVSSTVYRWIIIFLRRGLDSTNGSEVGIDPAEEAQAIFARGVPYRSASGDLKSRGFDGSGLDGIFNRQAQQSPVHHHGIRGGATAQGQY